MLMFLFFFLSYLRYKMRVVFVIQADVMGRQSNEKNVYIHIYVNIYIDNRFFFGDFGVILGE